MEKWRRKGFVGGPDNTRLRTAEVISRSASQPAGSSTVHWLTAPDVAGRLRKSVGHVYDLINAQLIKTEVIEVEERTYIRWSQENEFRLRQAPPKEMGFREVPRDTHSDWRTLDKAAEELGLHVTKVANWAYNGDIVSCKYGQRRMVSLSDVRERMARSALNNMEGHLKEVPNEPEEAAPAAERPDDLIGYDEAVRVSRRSRATLQRWIREGKLKKYEDDTVYPHRTLVSQSEMIEYQYSSGDRPQDLVRLSELCKNDKVAYNKAYSAISKGKLSRYEGEEFRGKPAILVSRKEFERFVGEVKREQKAQEAKQASTKPVTSLNSRISSMRRQLRGLELAAHYEDKKTIKRIVGAIVNDADVAVKDDVYVKVINDEVSRMVRRLAGRLEAAVDDRVGRG